MSPTAMKCQRMGSFSDRKRYGQNGVMPLRNEEIKAKFAKRRAVQIGARFCTVSDFWSREYQSCPPRTYTYLDICSMPWFHPGATLLSVHVHSHGNQP